MASILIASDDTAWANQVADCVEAEGYEPACVTNGLEACEQAAKTPPVLAFLDVNLPVYDGFETCRLLRAEPGVPAATPIFLVGNIRPTAKQLENVGATGYLPKTLDVVALRDLLIEHLQGYGNR